MTRFKSLALSILLAVAVISTATAQTFDDAVTYLEGENYLLYEGTVPFAAATSNVYTQYFHIGDANVNEAYLVLIPNDTADVKITVQFSNDRLAYDSLTTSVTDSLGYMAAGRYAVYDTLATHVGASIVGFKANRWARLLFDGQTTNEATSLDWKLYLRKQAGIRGSAAVANRRTS